MGKHENQMMLWTNQQGEQSLTPPASAAVTSTSQGRPNKGDKQGTQQSPGLETQSCHTWNLKNKGNKGTVGMEGWEKKPPNLTK